MTTKTVQIYEVLKDQELVFTGGYQDCWNYVHNHQSQSVLYATNYGGWSIMYKRSV